MRRLAARKQRLDDPELDVRDDEIGGRERALEHIDLPRLDDHAVARRILLRHFDRDRVHVDRDDGPKPSRAAAIATTPEPQPASSRLDGGLRARSSSDARVVGCAPVPKARPGSITTAGSPAAGSSQGGPTQRPPARTA